MPISGQKKGKGKVAAKAAVMFLSYNIRRAVTLAGGAQQLIHRVRGREYGGKG